MWPYLVAVGLVSLYLIVTAGANIVYGVFWVVLWVMNGFSVERMYAKDEDE